MSVQTENVLQNWKEQHAMQFSLLTFGEEAGSHFGIPKMFLDIPSSCSLRHYPSWRCLACPLPWPRQWLLPRSAGSSLFHTSCCLRWSPAPPEDGSHGTFSGTKKGTGFTKRCPPFTAPGFRRSWWSSSQRRQQHLPQVLFQTGNLTGFSLLAKGCDDVQVRLLRVVINQLSDSVHWISLILQTHMLLWNHWLAPTICWQQNC